MESALSTTVWKEQGRNRKRVKLLIKEYCHIPGIFNVAVSRVEHPKHNHIPEGHWPSALDIRVQRLNGFVLEAELFERAVKIVASRTLRNYAVGKEEIYGVPWSNDECEAANFITEAYRAGIKQNVSEIHLFIRKNFEKSIDTDIIKRVILKLDNSHESLLKEPAPFLDDKEYNLLISFKKQKRRKAK